MSFLEKGPISFYDIQNTLGGSNPISIDEYYRGGEYTTNYNNNIINEKIIYSKPKFTTKSSLNGESISTNNIQYTDYNYIIFKNNSLIPKLYYNLTFSENTLCDVLIVGGGGSGGIPYGGGGGAGGVIYLNNINVKNANISVGKGGDNIITSSGYYYGNKGCNSSFSYNNIYQENTIVTTNNLLVWYKFNGDGNDSSGNGKHLTTYGEISYHNDTTFGESVFFGSNAYLEYNNSDNFFNHNIFSVTTWFKFQTKVGYQSIASLRDADANTSGWTIYISNDSLTLQIGRGTGYGHWTMTPAVPISPNIWYHLVFTLNSSLQEIKKYINGVLQSTTTLTSYGLSDEPLRIGQGASEDDTPINNNLYYQSGGFIKDFRYYNKLLTDYEIYNLYKYDTLILLKPLYYDDIYNLQSLAEIKTNVNGWRLVRFLPDTSKTWYRIDDNLLGIEQYGDLYDLTKEWSVNFGYYDQICLSTASFSHFLHYNKLFISPTITIVDDTIINIDALTDIEQPMYPYTSDNSLYLVNLHPENDYNYLYFIYEDTNDNGYNQTEYYLDIPSGVLEFDILLVGGGASGQRSMGDGGGGGAIVYETNYVLSAGSYTIYVSGSGKAINSGEFNYYTGTIWDDESTTQFSGIKNNTSDTFVLKAMGAKNIFNEGVGRDNSRIGNPSGGSRIENIGTVLNGDGTNLSKGGDGYNTTGRSGYGQDGPQVNITGTNTYYAGGGGGGNYMYNNSTGRGGYGGNGGGGIGTHYGTGGVGTAHLGAGGGGGGNNRGVGAYGGGSNGGSGVVIIKFKKPSFASNVIQNPNNTSLEFLYQDNDNPKNLDLLQDNRGMCVFVRNSNIINPITIQLQKKAEQVTLEYGWRIVRFLPYSSSTNWYSYDDNAMGTNNEDGNIYDYTNEWTLPFGHFDEILFSTFDMSHWLRTKKSEISISGYTNTNRNVLSSSRNFTNHYVKWHNRIDNEEDPFISLYDHLDFSPETHMHCLYAENNSSDNKELLNNYLHGGVCVFVRDSSRIYDTNPITKYKTLTFIHDNSNNNQTEYTINFDTEAICDILIIAGGGGGGSDNAGGGGAGGLVFLENVKLNGSVIVKVGKGGNGGVNQGRGVNGFNSSVYNFEALGGGGGSCGNGSNIGSNGGSGGGGAGESDPGNGGISLQINHLTVGYGNNGGNGGSGSDKGGGGGGGAGSVGKDAGYLATDNGYGGAGGDGLYIINNKNFKNHFNIIDDSIGHHINDNIYFAGGGGAGNTNGRDSIDLFDGSGYKTNRGGLGGGGAGGLNNSSNSGIDGLPNTGSGGGGGYYNNTTQGSGGNGGSGIVLIRISNKVFNYIANGGGGGGTVIPRNTFHNNNDNNIVNSTTIERMYPPIRNLSSSSHTISGQEYGNGLYQTNQSSYHSSQWKGFSAFQESVTVGYHGAGGQYNTSGTYLKSNYLVSGYNGDWITINMPQKINLTKYAFTLRSGSYSGRVPKKYKIYGSNDGSNWDVLVHKDDSDANPVYTNSKFEESVITVNTYNHFAVVVNKLIGGGNVDSLNLNEWYIYGKEYYTTYSTYLPNTTITKNIIDKQLVVIPKNLIAYYKFEKNFEDSSGNDNHLIPSNSYTPTIINNNSYGYGLRMLNNINTNNTENVSLDNSNSISVRNGTLRMPTFNLVNKEYTISFYYKILNNLDTYSGVFILGENERVSTSGSIEMYHSFNNSLNELKIIYRNNTIVDGGVIFNPIIDYWYNITITLKSSELIVYIDNSPKFILSFSNGLPDDIYDCNYFGCFNNSQYVYTRDDYLIRDFKIYDRQLSLTEIANLYIDNNIIIPKSLSYDGEKLLEEEILIYNYEDKSIYEFMAEKITGVQGWHHVKHLNKDATEWYPENTEEGRSFFEVKDETFDSYGSFTKSFPDKFNELLFTRSDGNGNVDRYVQCLKTDLETIIAYTNWTNSIQSIKTQNGELSQFRGFGRYSSYVNRAPMILSRDSHTNEADYNVYEEHYQTSTINESNHWHSPIANKQYDVFARETRYDDKSIYELMSENVTGVQGWYHVKHLNKDATQWYPENTEEGRTFFEVKDEVFDSYGSFTKPFPDDFDELLFTRSDGNGNVDRYIHCSKSSIDGILANPTWNYNIVSIKTQHGTVTQFRGFGTRNDYVNRAPMLISENSFDNQADYTVYEEHYQTSTINESNPWNAPVANKQYDVFARKSGTTTSIISLSSYDIIYWIQNSSNTSYLASIKNWKLKASEPSGNNWFSNGLLNDVPSTSHLLFVVDGPSTQRQWLMILKSDIEGEHNWSSLSRTSDYGTYSSIGINTISGYQAPVITSTTYVQSSDAFIYREESDSTWFPIPPTDRKYYVFEENNQTSHIVKFTEETICDVLIVAGGGGGGGALAGGGGAGGVLYIKDAVLNGNYDIKVGKGGLGSVGHGVDAMNGDNSIITIDNIEYEAIGGGGGGSRNPNPYHGRYGLDGGSGGGGSHSNHSGHGRRGGYTTQKSINSVQFYGNNGGSGKDSGKYRGGGGGGSGTVGGDWKDNHPGYGGNGIDFSYIFGKNIGENGYIAAGGGGGGYMHDSADSQGIGGIGGGGDGGTDGLTKYFPQNGIDGMGGGGGGNYYGSAGGSGGSGTVIIKKKYIPDYKILTFTHDNSTNDYTEYLLNLNTDIECDILIVGGGGGGGKYGAGGGGGDVQYFNNVKLNGDYTIKVGNGGNGSTTYGATNGQNSTNGFNSEILNTQTIYIAAGGGSGTSWDGGDTNGIDPLITYTSLNNSSTGGGGGGAANHGISSNYNGNNPTGNPIISIYSGNGGGGGSYGDNIESGDYCVASGGGGGGGPAGQNGENAYMDETTVHSKSGNGGNGTSSDITGNILYYGGGGGGGGKDGGGTLDGITRYIIQDGMGGLGGGGNGNNILDENNGYINTGGGGGGGSANGGGNGGSGIVIIRYLNYFKDNIKTETIKKTKFPNYKTLEFIHDHPTDNYTEYTLTFNKDIICDILIVAGGGSGGRSENANRGGGGGGGGGLIYITSTTLESNIYTLRVGKGGIGSSSGQNGNESSIYSNSINYISYGGGGGGNTGTSGTSAQSGGSGGGGADYNGAAGSATKGSGTSSIYGFNGGKAVQPGGGYAGGSGAGGGGAGSTGQDSNSYSLGLGGSGKIITISGKNIEYAIGGNGGSYGGGTGINGDSHTGNGGEGAGRNGTRKGGNGGSGIIIIRYLDDIDDIDENELIISRNDNITSERLYQLTTNSFSLLEYDYYNLITWYKFDTDLNDSSGNQNHILGDNIFIDNSVYFNGTNSDYMQVSDTSNGLDIDFGLIQQNVGISFAFYFYHTGELNNKTILKTSQSAPYFYIRQNSNISRMSIEYTNAENNSTILYATINNNQDEWNHCVITIDNTNIIKMYINGLLQPLSTSGTYNNNFPIPIGHTLKNAKFGAHSSSGTHGFWKGYLKDFRIYDIILSSIEVDALFNNKQYNSAYKTLTFIHDNSNNNQTEYTINFDTEAICDILIIAGGGGGGSDNAGGGGAGGLVFLENVKLNGSIIVKVGKGGNGGVNQGRGVNGFNSSVYNFEALGGGGGSCGNGSNIGSNGGSGGGGAGESDPGNGGISLQINHLTVGYGNNGGNGGSSSDKGGGGGGGAGSVGKDAGYLATNNGYGGAGGDGLYIVNNKNFKNHFNIIDDSIGHHINDNIYFAGGGGAGNMNSLASMDTTNGSGDKTNLGGLGGGGAGGLNNSSNSGIDGLPNTGSGGGGGYYNGSTQGSGGNGGSGIVLIRYTYLRDIDGGSGGGTSKGDTKGLSYQLINNNYGYGNNGGKSTYLYSIGGGGGAGGIGLDGNANDYGGDGGIGIDFSNIFGNIFGDEGWFAAGGGGSGLNYFGNGGKGGGGIAGFLTNLPTDGLNNTGSGGGGNKDYGKSGAGGSGTVIVRYKPYIEYYYKQIRTSKNNYNFVNLNTDNIFNNIVNINFYNGKTSDGILQTAKALLLYPGNYRVSYYKGCQPGNNSDQATLYKCLSNNDGTWIMNHTCIPLTRGIGAQGDSDGTYGYYENVIIPDIPYFNFTLTEITAVFIHSTGTTGWINTYGAYNNEVELDIWDKYFKSQYNNRVFPDNNSTIAYDTWNGLSSEHNIKIIKYGETKPTISLSNFYILPTPVTKYFECRHSGTSENQTMHSFILTEDTVCSIIIVGGGGGGGAFGGGGGAGGVLFNETLTLSANTYTIKVGKGGNGAPTYNNGVNGSNGYNSSIIINGIEYIANGGGGGGTRNPSPYYGSTGNAGGSGGGGSHSNPTGHSRAGGASTQLSYTGWESYGNIGGYGRNGTGGGAPNHASGGGGGAGYQGENVIQSTQDDRTWPTYGGGGDGGAGKDFTHIFGINYGDNGWFAGGGGGQTYHNAGRVGWGSSYTGVSNNIRGFGGGGDGGFNGTNNSSPQKGIDGTGGGGGGAQTSTAGANGGSGIVLIKYTILNKFVVDYITNVPVITPNVSINDLDSNYKYVVFQNTGDNQTSYNITFNKSTLCDILIVGGGGGGGAGSGYGSGGGGGAGGLIYKTQETLSGTYEILVGKEGLGMTYSYSTMENYNNGSDSGIYDSSGNVLYLTKGGGAGGARKTNGASGGSGGGGGGGANTTPGTGASPINSVPYTHSIGNSGSDGNRYTKGGGGGGAGGPGSLATGTDTSAGNGYNEGVAGNGGLPIIVDITGENKAYAGGGGGGTWQVEPGEGGSVVIDGQIVKVGGDGGWQTEPGNGISHTGSGGGGAKHHANGGTVQNAGNGGSGIVIIKYRLSYQLITDVTTKYIIYKHDGTTENQNLYNLTFIEDVICDILIVAGGGGGGKGYYGGGGGAGGLIFQQNVSLTGTVNIKVGNGGYETNGFDSSIDSIVAIGGGLGGSRDLNTTGSSGGSGGGGSGTGPTGILVAGSGTIGQGNDGGDGYHASGHGAEGGGGGGAGFAGNDAEIHNYHTTKTGEKGGDGLAEKNNINFKTHFNITNTSIGEHHTDGKVYFAGGGGGSGSNAGSTPGEQGEGGLGGGGYKLRLPPSGAREALNNSGGGGGGQSGKGGSGIVIIRYNSIKPVYYMTYLHSDGTENQTIHNIIFPTNVRAQVLIVAGGGGGGARQGYNSGGGGGAGEVLETIINFDKDTSYTIKIGRGGNSSGTETLPAEEGFDSGIFLNSNVVKHCKGGGRGGFGKRVSSYTWNATDGGSGGGASRGNNNTQGVSIKYNNNGYGNDGRNANQEAGGGGGAGGIGTGSEKNPGGGYTSMITGTATNYASGGYGGWQYSQDYTDSGYGSGGGGRAATTNNTSIAIGESGNSGIIIIKCL